MTKPNQDAILRGSGQVQVAQVAEFLVSLASSPQASFELVETWAKAMRLPDPTAAARSALLEAQVCRIATKRLAHYRPRICSRRPRARG